MQETIHQRDFFTTNASERLSTDMRNSLGCTCQKDPMNKDDSFINEKISLRDAAEYDLDVTVVGQRFSKFVYESRKDGNMIQMYELNVVKDNKFKQLDDIMYSELQSRKRN